MLKNKYLKPAIFVLSSPSGGGKTTLVRFMQKKFPEIIYSVSITSRNPRPGDKDRYDYHFISPAAFRKGIKNKEFVEWAMVHGNYYGTPVSNISGALKKGRSALLDLDVVGAKKVKKLFPEANLIFITAKSISELRKRLIARGQDDIKTIHRRLKNAKEELKQIKNFDFLIVNDDLSKAKEQMSAIYTAGICRIRSDKK